MIPRPANLGWGCICLNISQSGSSSFSAFKSSLCGCAVIIHFSHSMEKQCNVKSPSQFIFRMTLTTDVSVQKFVCGQTRKVTIFNIFHCWNLMWWYHSRMAQWCHISLLLSKDYKILEKNLLNDDWKYKFLYVFLKIEIYSTTEER